MSIIRKTIIWRTLSKVKARIHSYVLNYFLKGDNVFCPCCNKGFITFLPFGLKEIRFNAQCPNCKTLERHRLLYLFIQAKTSLLDGQNKKILHFAPERFFYDLFSSKIIEYLPCDKFEKGYSYPKGTLPMDIREISLDDNSIDALICSHVLEHVDDDRKAIKELHRVLAPKGFALIQVPIDYNRAITFEDFNINTPEKRNKYYGQYDHLRIYGNDFSQRLSETFTTVRQIDYFKELDLTSREKYGLKKGDIFYCEK